MGEGIVSDGCVCDYGCTCVVVYVSAAESVCNSWWVCVLPCMWVKNCSVVLVMSVVGSIAAGRVH